MKSLFILRGIVIHGKKRGKTLGFPTANIIPDRDVPEGIYASQVNINGRKYPAATFVGAAKTYNEADKKAEVYILDFSENIYGKEIIVKLYNKIRENQKFSTEKELVAQVRKDVEEVRKIFK